MWSLHLRMWILLTVLFGIIYAVVVTVGVYLGIANVYFCFIASFLMLFIQYLIGPKLVEWIMRVRYIRKEEHSRLYQLVQGLAIRANIPMPRIGIAQIPIPNAFAFGRGLRDGRVCVTEGILQLLNEDELKAVLGHELSHLKNRDVLTITLLSVIPMVMYMIARNSLFYGRRRDERGSNSVVLIGLAAFILYFITNLLVLYVSRIREYFADKGSLLLGNRPSILASSLYKLVYGSARLDRAVLREAEGLKAFFVNDPSAALKEIRELKELDLDRSGTLDAQELELLRSKKIHLNFSDRLLELLSTHPNMLKRIKQLSKA